MREIPIDLTDLSSAASKYYAPHKTCRVIGARSALYTTLTTGDSTITISDGTTTIGTITITQSGCAVGDVDTISFDSTSEGKVEVGPSTPIKIANDATPGQGAAIVTLVLGEYWAD